METTILIITGIVAASALVLICLLLKMIVTKDYSLLFGESKPQNVRFPSPGSLAQQVTVAPGLDMEVAHFVKEPAEWKSETERKQATQNLVEIQKRRQRK